MSGLWSWKVLSTPIPLDIFLTIKDELRPEFLTDITTPSKACNLVRSPSLTLTETDTVSPGLNDGISFLSCDFSKSLTIEAGDFSTSDIAGASSSTGASSSGEASSAGAASSRAASSAGASS